MKTYTRLAWNRIICLLTIGLLCATGPAALAEDITLKAGVTDADAQTGTVEFSFDVQDSSGAETDPAEDAAAEEDAGSASGPETAAIPEPATLGVIALGLAGILVVRRQWRKR